MLAFESVELLHLLDRVALDRRPHALADGAKQVDEDAAPQQPVDLDLAGAVAAHQPLEGGRLVWGVVIDMERRVAFEPLHEEVDEPLERRTFRLERERAGLVARPDRVERAVGLQDAEEVVETVLERERVAFDVEEQVAFRRLGERGEPPFRVDRLARCRQQQLVARCVGEAPFELDPGLLADADQRLFAGALDLRRHGERQPAEVRRASQSHGPRVPAAAVPRCRRRG